MRRSVREAIVGFSLVGAVAGFAATMLWLRGVELGAKVWRVTVDFANASGLAERSPVTYRGIFVGAVENIEVTPEFVRATLEINQSDLRMPLPVLATVASGSLLGGDSQVNLISRGNPVPADAPLPHSRRCAASKIVLCDGARISGQQAASMSTVMETLQSILNKAQKEKLVTNMVDSMKQFDSTARDADELIKQLRKEIVRAEPMIRNLNKASLNAADATGHLNNMMATLDNPKTLSDLKQTVSNARSLTATIDSVGGDVEKLTADPEFMKGVRSVTIGLGEFFNELYPAQTDARSTNP